MAGVSHRRVLFLSLCVLFAVALFWLAGRSAALPTASGKQTSVIK